MFMFKKRKTTFACCFETNKCRKFRVEHFYDGDEQFPLVITVNGKGIEFDENLSMVTIIFEPIDVISF